MTATHATEDSAVRVLSVDINDLCRDRIDGGMASYDVAIALIRVLAYLAVEYGLEGGQIVKRLSMTLAVAAGRKATKQVVAQ